MILGHKVGLRLVEEQDLDLIAQWRNDPRTMIYLATQMEISLAGQKRFFENLMQDPSRMQFMIIRLEDQRPVGTIGFQMIDRPNQSAHIAPFFMDPDLRGELLGLDALTAIQRYGFEELNLNRLWGTVMSYNRAMLMGVQTAGMKPEGFARKASYAQGQWHDMYYMSMLREEWPGQQKMANRLLVMQD